MPSPPTTHPPIYLTAELPPIGGGNAVIKQRPEDFLVDEQPLYQPSGEGEHIYLLIEKRNLTTMQAARIIARHFGVQPGAVGYAGLKDKHAITRQVVSVHAPGKKPEDFPMLAYEGNGGQERERLGVLWADLHTNKLRRGHLLGNRFSIRIRGVQATEALIAHKALLKLEKLGVPNRFGEQRFGYRGTNHHVGRAMVLNDAQAAVDALLAPLAPPQGIDDGQIEARRLYAEDKFAEALDAFASSFRAERAVLAALARGQSTQRALGAIARPEQDLYLSAFQSAIFNVVLDERLREGGEGSLGTLRPGDLAIKHDNDAVFGVTDAEMGAALDERLLRFEISPSGPMWGPKMLLPPEGSDTRAREIAALEATGVTLAGLEAFGTKRPGRMPGERRPLRVPLTDPDVEGGVDEHGAYIRLAFDLPAGAYATIVLRELIKSPHPLLSTLSSSAALGDE